MRMITIEERLRERILKLTAALQAAKRVERDGTTRHDAACQIEMSGKGPCSCGADEHNRAIVEALRGGTDPVPAWNVLRLDPAAPWPPPGTEIHIDWTCTAGRACLLPDDFDLAAPDALGKALGMLFDVGVEG